MPPRSLGQRLCFVWLLFFPFYFPPLTAQLNQLFFRLLVLGSWDDFNDRFDHISSLLCMTLFFITRFLWR